MALSLLPELKRGQRLESLLHREDEQVDHKTSTLNSMRFSQERLLGAIEISEKGLKGLEKGIAGVSREGGMPSFEHSVSRMVGCVLELLDLEKSELEQWFMDVNESSPGR
ncbi:hypothetical protein MMC11_008259 [Xylographa trunciseda]|nr:hypothetical protein [Xylographa trunciseda]